MDPDGKMTGFRPRRLMLIGPIEMRVPEQSVRGAWKREVDGFQADGKCPQP